MLDSDKIITNFQNRFSITNLLLKFDRCFVETKNGKKTFSALFIQILLTTSRDS